MTGEGAEDRLTVGSDVVGAAHEYVEPDVLENREQLAHRRAHVPAPHGRARLRIARRAEVARGNTSSVELLGGEPPLDEITSDSRRRSWIGPLRKRCRGSSSIGRSAPSGARSPRVSTPASSPPTARRSGPRSSRAPRRARRGRPPRPSRGGRRAAGRSPRSLPAAYTCTRPPRSTSLPPETRSGGRAPASPPPRAKRRATARPPHSGGEPRRSAARELPLSARRTGTRRSRTRESWARRAAPRRSSTRRATPSRAGS